MKKTLIFCIVALWLSGVLNTDDDVGSPSPCTTEQCEWKQASWQAYCDEWGVDYLHPTEEQLEQYEALKYLYL